METRHGHADGAKHHKGKLDSQSIILLLVHGLFSIANALSGTFVNVYIWKAKSDFALIGWFALIQQLTMAITFWVAGKWVKEHNKMNSLRAGIALSAVFYLMVLWLGQGAVTYIWLLGIVQGMASGCFWLAFNVVYFEVTDPDNRDQFNGWAGIIGSSSGILTPWLSGYFIAKMGDSGGYRFIFSLSLVIFFVGVIVSFFLKKRKVSGTYYWIQAIKDLRRKNNPWRLVVPALSAQGIREGVFGFIIGLLVYIATKKELQLGNFTLITSAVAFVSFLLLGRWLKRRYRGPAMLLGTVMMSAVILPLFWKLNYFTLLIFGIGTALFMPLYTIPMTSSVFDLIGGNAETAQARVEYIVLRELALCGGRVVGTLVFIIVVSQTTSPFIMNILLLCIGSAPIATWILMRGCLAPRKG
ncbi:MFS transporter [Paenibacillus swuensis]|uniref:MFS transporter n=1 Tax=Paenibacillus swuensis TaxID=1178515 RepID=A0A172TPY4_9BACL|nr:MFS transporter [Paenibacillus swuensis]